jgi:hypothetical protein
VPQACESFARKYGVAIAAKQLRQNFLLHLFNLWDSSLISSNTISSTLAIADKCAHGVGGVGGVDGVVQAPGATGAPGKGKNAAKNTSGSAMRS